LFYFKGSKVKHLISFVANVLQTSKRDDEISFDGIIDLLNQIEKPNLVSGFMSYLMV
jgi:hypothetical protein